MDRSQSLDDNLLIGARPKQSVAREQARQQMERSRSNSRGRSIMTRRTRGSAAELEDESTPIRPRTDSVGFIDTPIGMGPATTLMSPRRYSELGTVGVELTTEPARAAALPSAAALPVPPPRDRHHAARDSVSLETDDDSASTSVIMDHEYVMLDDQSATVI